MAPHADSPRRRRWRATAARLALGVVTALASAYAVHTVQDCPYGETGCMCESSWWCDDAAARCEYGMCYGPGYAVPGSYPYSPRSWEDGTALKDALRELYRVEPSMRVADIGCGLGGETRYLVKRLGGGGVVYATDLLTEALETTREGVESDRGDRPQADLRLVHVTDPRATGLEGAPDGSIDLILMMNSVTFDVGDEVADAEYLAKFVRKLRPGGRLLWHYNWLESFQLTPLEMDALMRRAGFEGPVERMRQPSHRPPTTFILPSGRTRPPRVLTHGYSSVYRRPLEG